MESEGRCHAEASIELGLDPQAAWDVVMDWERQSRWMLLTRVWATEQGGTGVGGGVAARTSVGAIGFTDDMVITHWDPPRECTVKHLGKLVRGTGTFTITATSSTTPAPTTWPEASTKPASTTPDSTTTPASTTTPGTSSPRSASSTAPESASAMPASSTAPESASATPASSTAPESASATPASSTTPESASATPASSTAPESASATPASSTAPSSSAPTDSGAGGSGGCTFTWAEDVVPPLGRVGVLAWPVVRPAFELMMRVSLRRLVREVAG